MNLATKEGVLRFCELRRAEMAGCFERLGRFEMNKFSFGAYCFVTHDIVLPSHPLTEPWKTGARLPEPRAELCQVPEALFGLIPPDQETAIFGRVMRSLCALGRAVGTVVMSEMWHARIDPKGRPWQEARAELPDSLADYDGRREALYMSLEHSATGRRIWMADISRNPTRLAPWREMSLNDAEGRLVDLTNWKS